MRVCISNLADHQAWVSTIAEWHHNEWLKTHQKINGSQRLSEDIEQKLSERRIALQRHVLDEILPVTFVAHSNEVPLGTVSLVYYQFTNDHRPTEWLTNLFVSPEYRCQGIASQLLSFAVNYAASHEVSRLLLYTSDQVEFYRKRNWRYVNRGVVQGQRVEIMDYCFKN